jgi:Domain of unknown function (DUF4386)
MTPNSTASARKFAAALLILEPLLFFTAFAILSSAINWPASLGLPFNEALPSILAKLSEVRLGYGFYLASSLLTIPLGIALYNTLGREKPGMSMQLILAFMAAAAIFKAMGITRWLIAMPALANLHAGAANDPTLLAAIQTSFVTLNEYAGGGLGEWMGVGLMSGLWMVMLAYFLRNRSLLAAILFAIGGVTALLLCWNEFQPLVDTAILQGLSRFASMIGQFWLAFLLLRNVKALA